MSDRPNVFRSTDFPRRDTRRFPQHGFPAPGHTAFSAARISHAGTHGVFRSTDFPRWDARRFPQHGFPTPGHTAFSAVHHNFPERRRRSFFGASAGTVYLYINPKYFGYKFGMLPLAAGRRFRYNER